MYSLTPYKTNIVVEETVTLKVGEAMPEAVILAEATKAVETITTIIATATTKEIRAEAEVIITTTATSAKIAKDIIVRTLVLSENIFIDYYTLMRAVAV